MRRSFVLFDASNRPTENFGHFMLDAQIPGNTLPEIDDALQLRFFQRNSDGSPKERWELDKIPGLDRPKILNGLEACGFIRQTVPGLSFYNYVAWPGALVTRAVARLDDLVMQWSLGVRWEQTIVFGGKRPLNPEKESFEACSNAIHLKSCMYSVGKKIWEDINPQTELDMMRWVWTLFGASAIDRGVVFVDAPMKPPVKEDGPPIRPNTEDTILEWLKNEPIPGSMLLSSGAPYGMAQDEAFWSLLGPKGFTIDTFGHYAPDLPIESFMREVAGCVNRIRRARGL